MFTHYPKHPDCKVCKMTKITWARCKVKAWEKRRGDCICYSIWRRDDGRSYSGKRVKAEKETEETMLEWLKPFAVELEEIDSKFFESASRRQLHARQRGTFKWWKVFSGPTREEAALCALIIQKITMCEVCDRTTSTRARSKTKPKKRMDGLARIHKIWRSSHGSPQNSERGK